MLLSLFDPSQQLCRQGVAFVAIALYFSLSRQRRFTFEHLRAQFHLPIADSRIHGEFAQAGWYVPAKIHDLEGCAFPMQLTLPSYAGRSDCRATRDRSETARVFGN